MKPLFYKRDRCNVCEETGVDLVVPLAAIPVVTPNVGTGRGPARNGELEASVPLDLYLCRSCGHLQLLDVIDPEVQYSDYLYTTSVSLGLPDHFVRLADTLISDHGLEAGSLVVEMGSNDGTLLRAFKARGMRVLGIDPAQDTAERASRSGIETLARFFSRALAEEIRGGYGPARLVIANNVLANIDNVGDIIDGIHDLLADDGVFVCETGYGSDVIRGMLLDTVHHEHLAFFLTRPLQTLFERHGMTLLDAERIATKGGSLRIAAQRSAGPRAVSESVARMIAEETRDGLYGIEPYERMRTTIAGITRRLAEIVAREKERGREVAGYGTSVGTVTLLHQFDLAGSIDFLVDDSPFKDRLSGPGYDIPIVVPDQIYARRPGAIIVFAWRYAEPILGKHRRYIDEGGRFVIPLPDVTVAEGR